MEVLFHNIIRNPCSEDQKFHSYEINKHEERPNLKKDYKIKILIIQIF